MDCGAEINPCAFWGCSAVSTLTVTLSGAIAYGKDVFADCIFLEEATLRDAAAGDSFFGVMGSIPYLERVTLTEGIAHVGNGAFFGCAQLTEVTIPATVTAIDGRAFIGCASLESVTLPDTLQSLGENAFSHCLALRTVSLPGTLTIPLKGGKYGAAFADCPALEELTLTGGAMAEHFGQIFIQCGAEPVLRLSDTITVLGDNAFQGCDFLTAIILPEGLTALGNHAFDGCRALTEVTLPDSLAEVGYDAFRDTPLLSEAAALYPPPWRRRSPRTTFPG